MPAVSNNLIGIPLIFISALMMSLVVPGSLLVIAISELSILLNKVDLPTFGLPHITTCKPSLYNLPIENESIRFFNSFWIKLSESK